MILEYDKRAYSNKGVRTNMLMLLVSRAREMVLMIHNEKGLLTDNKNRYENRLLIKV